MTQSETGAGARTALDPSGTREYAVRCTHMGYVETPWHIVLLLLIALLLFGGKKLPEIGRSLGSGVREFKDGIAGGDTTGRPSQAASDATPIASESETV